MPVNARLRLQTRHPGTFWPSSSWCPCGAPHGRRWPPLRDHYVSSRVPLLWVASFSGNAPRKSDDSRVPLPKSKSVYVHCIGEDSSCWPLENSDQICSGCSLAHMSENSREQGCLQGCLIQGFKRCLWIWVVLAPHLSAPVPARDRTSLGGLEMVV